MDRREGKVFIDVNASLTITIDAGTDEVLNISGGKFEKDNPLSVVLDEIENEHDRHRDRMDALLTAALALQPPIKGEG